ncbi:MAG: hypothetical protein ACRDRD_08260, partial [Pseudonocardiaceae bacterium]
MTVELSKTLIAAGGTSTTDVTATVTDGTNPVDWDTLNVSIDGGPPIAMIDTGTSEGKYTATVNSTNTLGPVIVKATDSTPGTPVDGQTTLTQYGPATSVA